MKFEDLTSEQRELIRRKVRQGVCHLIKSWDCRTEIETTLGICSDRMADDFDYLASGLDGPTTAFEEIDTEMVDDLIKDWLSE